MKARQFPLFLAVICSATSVVADKRHDLKWDFGAFASVEIVDDVQLRYCYNADRKPMQGDCGMFIYTPTGDKKYEVTIDSGTFIFFISDADASAEFVNKQGQRYTASD